MKRSSPLFAMLSAALILPGHAALTQNQLEVDGSYSGNGTTVAAASNLISTYGTLNSTDFVPFQGDSYTVLNDGSLSTGTAVSGSGSPWTLAVTLDTSANTNGYTITGLDAFTSWTTDYVNQAYSVSYSTVSDPTDFISLGSFAASNTSQTFQPATLETLLTPGLGQTDIATNVAALQYNFTQGAGDNSHIEAYTELEAFGSPASLPEPSTCALMLMGGLGVVFIVRRKRALTS
jgi:hypothetical protein